MFNINNMTINEQLFTELTPEEGAVIEGGFRVIREVPNVCIAQPGDTNNCDIVSLAFSLPSNVTISEINVLAHDAIGQRHDGFLVMELDGNEFYGAGVRGRGGSGSWHNTTPQYRTALNGSTLTLRSPSDDVFIYEVSISYS